MPSEPHPLSSKPVEMRSANNRMPSRGKTVTPKLIKRDQQDIRSRAHQQILANDPQRRFMSGIVGTNVPTNPDMKQGCAN